MNLNLMRLDSGNMETSSYYLEFMNTLKLVGPEKVYYISDNQQN